jgi:acyl carrier protein
MDESGSQRPGGLHRDEPDMLSRLEAIFSEKLKVVVPSRDTDLLAEGILDSILFVDLLLTLEQDFGITILIDELDLEHFQSIRRIADFIAGQTAIVAGAAARQV